MIIVYEDIKVAFEEKKFAPFLWTHTYFRVVFNYVADIAANWQHWSELRCIAGRSN
jgi:hypothetical protein